MRWLLALLLFPATCLAADPWSDDDVAREVAYQVVDAVDWMQTRWITQHLNIVHEQNSILGKHPSVGNVNVYFATTSIAHALIANLLPSEHRRAFQYVTIGIEIGAVQHNFALGIGITF